MLLGEGAAAAAARGDSLRCEDVAAGAVEVSPTGGGLVHTMALKPDDSGFFCFRRPCCPSCRYLIWWELEGSAIGDESGAGARMPLSVALGDMAWSPFGVPCC